MNTEKGNAIEGRKGKKKEFLLKATSPQQYSARAGLYPDSGAKGEAARELAGLRLWPQAL